MAMATLFCSSALAREFDYDAFPVLHEDETLFREALALEAKDSGQALELMSMLKGSSHLPPDAVNWALARLLGRTEGSRAGGKGSGKGSSKETDEIRRLLNTVAEIDDSPYRAEALSMLAELAQKERNYKSAAAYLRRLEKAFDEPDDKAKALGRLLEALDFAGDKKGAGKVALRLWTEFAHLPQSDEGEAYLAKATGDPYKPVKGEDIYRRGKTLLDKGGREKAVETLTRLRKSLRRNSKLAPKVDLALGKALHYLRRNEEALTPLSRAAKNPDRPATEQQARFWRARSLFALNRGDEGAKDLVKLADKWTRADRASVWLYQAYRVFLGRSMNKQAAGAKDKLLKRYPTSEMALDVGWWDAWELYEGGEFKKAARAFGSSVENANRGWQHVRGLFWSARALAKAGDKNGADRGFKRLIESYPIGYYSRLASDELAGKKGAWQLLDPRGRGGVTPSAKLPKKADLALGGVLARPAAYLRLGLPEAAKRILKTRKRNSPATLWLLYWAEDFHGVVRGADCSWVSYPWLGVAGEAQGEAAGSEECRLSYTPAYPASLAAASAEADIHPHLVLSIARTESHFNPDGYSSWEARGLMQFIPATAEHVAKKLKMEHFNQQQLFLPSVALRLGAKHLRDLLDRFDGDVVSAVAAYNGGAAAVKRWRKKFPDADLAEFVERIPYRETKRYVKKVFTALDAYDQLDGPGLWSAK
jgi:soluble lytic murein transglycosylase